MKNSGARENSDHAVARDYYNGVYYRRVVGEQSIPAHYRRLARRFAPWNERKLLDVGCGTGMWLRAAAELGAVPVGIDISEVALRACRRSLSSAELYCGPAEYLPFRDQEFDFVSCLGALEHFADPKVTLHEMVRVAKRSADFLLLVPNAHFLPRRLGLYLGTEQAAVREDVRSIKEWQQIFERAGLRIQARWKDLHVLSVSWMARGPWYGWPIRAAQALVLPVWPLSWQYQVYHHCTFK